MLQYTRSLGKEPDSSPISRFNFLCLSLKASISFSWTDVSGRWCSWLSWVVKEGFNVLLDVEAKLMMWVSVVLLSWLVEKFAFMCWLEEVMSLGSWKVSCLTCLAGEIRLLSLLVVDVLLLIRLMGEGVVLLKWVSLIIPFEMEASVL